MKAPAGLTPAGRAAWRRAVLAIADQAPDDRFVDAAERYAQAVDLVARARSAWKAQGCPVVETQTNGVTGVHPLVKAIQEGERNAARFAAAVKLDLVSSALKGAAGRPSGAVSARDRVAKSTPARLKAVR